MSVYGAKDYLGNACERAIKFRCDNVKNNYADPDGTQVIRATYELENTRTKFACTLAPQSFYDFGIYMEYVHVNLYKDEVLLHSMDISKDSKPLELEYDLTGAKTFTIELKYEAQSSSSQYGASIVFDRARFE